MSKVLENMSVKKKLVHSMVYKWKDMLKEKQSKDKMMELWS